MYLALLPVLAPFVLNGPVELEVESFLVSAAITAAAWLLAHFMAEWFFLIFPSRNRQYLSAALAILLLLAVIVFYNFKPPMIDGQDPEATYYVAYYLCCTLIYFATRMLGQPSKRKSL